MLNVPKLNKPHKLTIGPNGYSTCGIDMEGVKCWGANYSKQLKVPKGLNMIDDIFSGSRFHCANKSNNIMVLYVFIIILYSIIVPNL